MANFNMNKVILGGRLTSDPELKTTPNGVSCTNFTIAVNRRFGKDNVTDFIDCTAWRNTADFICKYFKKASSICVEGSIQVRKWTDKDSNKRYSTEIVVDEAYFVDGKSEQQPSAGAYVPDAYSAAPQMTEIEDDNLPF